jgi:hypothetical protein
MVGGVARIRLGNGGTVDGTIDESGRHDGISTRPTGSTSLRLTTPRRPTPSRVDAVQINSPRFLVR